MLNQAVSVLVTRAYSRLEFCMKSSWLESTFPYKIRVLTSLWKIFHPVICIQILNLTESFINILPPISNLYFFSLEIILNMSTKQYKICIPKKYLVQFFHPQRIHNGTHQKCLQCKQQQKERANSKKTMTIIFNP